MPCSWPWLQVWASNYQLWLSDEGLRFHISLPPTHKCHKSNIKIFTQTCSTFRVSDRIPPKTVSVLVKTRQAQPTASHRLICALRAEPPQPLPYLLVYGFDVIHIRFTVTHNKKGYHGLTTFSDFTIQTPSVSYLSGGCCSTADCSGQISANLAGRVSHQQPTGCGGAGLNFPDPKVAQVRR